MPRVIHLLPECELFSEFHGGAISRWVANVLRGDTSGSVVAIDADDSWHHPVSQVTALRCLHAYHWLLKWTNHRIPWVLRRLILRFGLHRVVTQMQPGDVMWIHNRPEFAAALAKPVHRAGGKIVLHMHNAHLQTADHRIIHDLEVDCIVYVSRYLEQVSQPSLIHSVPSEVLYNGADAALFSRMTERQISKRPMKVLFASRVVSEKGAHILSAALQQLHQEGVSIEGMMVGGSDFGNAKPDHYMQMLVRSAPANLSFHPYCAGKALVRLFHEADVFCLPSVWHDPFPLAPLEAMAAGLPVVATHSGGIPEALQYGGGILVNRGSIESLTDALRLLASDPDLRVRLSVQASNAFHQHFRWETVRAQYDAIVGQVANA